MADYTEFQSTGGSYSFSKGPKSLYVPGASNRFISDGIVLNVPQTDEDDEWGGTERISQESLADVIARLESEVEDPSGSGTTGLLNKMLSLVGTSVKAPATPTLINLATPSLTLGNIQVNATADKINIGSSTELNTTQLKIGSYFLVDAVTTDYGAISFHHHGVGVTLTLSDTLSSEYIRLTIGSSSYSFNSTGMSFPASSIMSGIGTLSATTITATTINTTTANAAAINVNTGTGTIFQVDNINFGKFTSAFGGFTFNSPVIVNGDISTTVSLPNIGSGSNRFGTLYCQSVDASTSVSATTLTVSGNILPAVTGVPNIGSPGNIFRNVYCTEIYSFNTISAGTSVGAPTVAATTVTATTVNAITKVATKLLELNNTVAGTAISAVSAGQDIGDSFGPFNSIYINNVQVNTAILPLADNVVNIGASPSQRFANLYLGGTLSALSATIANIIVSSSLLPSGSVDVGATGNRFNTIYAGTGTFTLGVTSQFLSVSSIAVLPSDTSVVSISTSPPATPNRWYVYIGVDNRLYRGTVVP